MSFEKKKIIIKKLDVTSSSQSQVVSVNSDIKKNIKKKPICECKQSTVKKTPVKKTIKKNSKEFPKEGQTKPTPPESDSLRKFYTSLLKQKKDSEMALKWCTEHGLAPKQKDSIHISIKKLNLLS
jgi:hypothetical protein